MKAQTKMCPIPIKNSNVVYFSNKPHLNFPQSVCSLINADYSIWCKIGFSERGKEQNQLSCHPINYK